jgi:hypothetical protein
MPEEGSLVSLRDFGVGWIDSDDIFKFRHRFVPNHRASWEIQDTPIYQL